VKFDAILIRQGLPYGEVGDRLVLDGTLRANPTGFREAMKSPTGAGISVCSDVTFWLPDFSSEEGCNRWCAVWAWEKDYVTFNGGRYVWEKIEDGVYGGKFKRGKGVTA